MYGRPPKTPPKKKKMNSVKLPDTKSAYKNQCYMPIVNDLK
jgi:hypothetical protein